jgi:hypothetical protein
MPAERRGQDDFRLLAVEALVALLQIRAQEREIRMLQRAGASAASAELLLSRMRAKVDDLCRERDDLRRLGKASVVGGNDP